MGGKYFTEHTFSCSFLCFLFLLSVSYNIYVSCTGFTWAVRLNWLDNVLLYTVIDQDIFFPVTDSCCANVRNGIITWL